MFLLVSFNDKAHSIKLFSAEWSRYWVDTSFDSEKMDVYWTVYILNEL